MANKTYLASAIVWNIADVAVSVLSDQTDPLRLLAIALVLAVSLLAILGLLRRMQAKVLGWTTLGYLLLNAIVFVTNGWMGLLFAIFVVVTALLMGRAAQLAK